MIVRNPIDELEGLDHFDSGGVVVFDGRGTAAWLREIELESDRDRLVDEARD